MKVRIEKAIPVPAPADAAWTLLQDLEAVAACMPGARLTERIDAAHHKGTVTVKFGPATLAFRGDLEVREVDPAARSLRLMARGTDGGGSSGAAMDLAARIEAVDAAASRLVGAADVSMSGKAAAFGARMVNTVADQVLDQFAGNFAARAAALSPPGGAAEAAPAPGQARPLNGLALAWAALRAWLRGLLAKKAA